MGAAGRGGRTASGRWSCEAGRGDFSFHRSVRLLVLIGVKCSRHDKVFDLRSRFKSILVKTAPLGLFRVSSGVQTLQQDRLLKVGTQFFPAKPRCEAMWLAIAPSALLFWLQGSKRPNGAVRKELLSSSLPGKRFPFITTLFGRQHGRTPNFVELHEFAGGQEHGCTESIRAVRIVRGDIFPECSNFVIRNVEGSPNEKIMGHGFVLILVGRRVCFSTRESVVQLIAQLCIFPENTVAFPHSLEHAVAELFLTL